MKSSLRFQSEDTLNVTRPALVWHSAFHSHRDTEKSFIKARIMTGTFKLQAYESMYNPAVSDTCPLCGEGTGDRWHFLVVCTSLTTAREPYLSHIRRMMYICCDRTQWDSIHRILVGDGDYILCTKPFVGSGLVSLWLSRVNMGDCCLYW